MAYKFREELVGKRFLSLSYTDNNAKSGKIVSDWGWRGGVIRAATHRDSKSQDLQVSRFILFSKIILLIPRFSSKKKKSKTFVHLVWYYNPVIFKVIHEECGWTFAMI